MSTKRIFRTISLAGIFLGVAGLGWIAGFGLNKLREAEAARARPPADARTVQRIFESNLLGIAIDSLFPDIPMWSADGTQAFEIVEVLPRGGLILVVNPGCGHCLEASVALQKALDAAGTSARHAILLSDVAEGTDSLGREMAAKGVRLPIYCDVQSALHYKYGLLGIPCYFSLDSLRRVISMGVIMKPYDDKLKSIASSMVVPGGPGITR